MSANSSLQPETILAQRRTKSSGSRGTCNCSCPGEEGGGYRTSQCTIRAVSWALWPGVSGGGRYQQTFLICDERGVILVLLELPSGLEIFEISEKVSPYERGAQVYQVLHRKQL